MVCQQRNAAELQHHERAVNLMQTSQTRAHERLIPIGFDVCLQCLTCVVQGFEEFALDPVKRKMFAACRHK